MSASSRAMFSAPVAGGVVRRRQWGIVGGMGGMGDHSPIDHKLNSRHSNATSGPTGGRALQRNRMTTQSQELTAAEAASFIPRHIGPSPADIRAMLDLLG